MLEDMSPDSNMLLLITLCILGVYTYESSLIILDTFNYSAEKYHYSKKILIYVFEDVMVDDMVDDMADE